MANICAVDPTTWLFVFGIPSRRMMVCVHTAACCNTLQDTSAHYNAQQLHCNCAATMLQLRCNYAATHCNASRSHGMIFHVWHPLEKEDDVCSHYNTLQHTATHCNNLQLRCNTMQHNATQVGPTTWFFVLGTHTGRMMVCTHTAITHTATHCNSLQLTATQCNTL